MTLNSEVKIKILFLCTGNSCRSQMAEGWARELKGERIEPYSAGTTPQAINPLAVKVMAEVGIDLTKQTSKHINSLIGVNFDYVVTVCDAASEACPILPGLTKKLHAGFEDPPKLAEGAKSEDEALPHYRRVRDEIKEYVKTLPEALLDQRFL